MTQNSKAYERDRIRAVNKMFAYGRWGNSVEISIYSLRDYEMGNCIPPPPFL